MEQNLDLARMTMKAISGEHFLRVQADFSLAQVVDLLRDHQCRAAVFAEGERWKVVTAEILPALLLQGPQALQQPVAAVAQSLVTLSLADPLSKLPALLEKNTWVGVVDGTELKTVLHWTSWARFTAGNRVARPYLVSPEWGSNQKASLARV